MSTRKIVCIRIGPARLMITDMAAATGRTASDVYRELLGEALAARWQDCTSRHRDPHATTCGHCGRALAQ